MFIQGNIQTVFDALYHLGVIDPVLDSDWAITEKAMKSKPQKLLAVLQAANSCNSDFNLLINKLHHFDRESLEFLALEVARELADYQVAHTLH